MKSANDKTTYSKLYYWLKQPDDMANARNLPILVESEDQQKFRFQVELEFVQCLANPNYLNFLAQRGIFKEATFINYLKYLLYWRQPEYAKYLKYPQSLHMLELLQYEQFRKELMNSQCARFIDDQQLLHWQHYQRKRMRLLQDQADKMASGGGVAAAPGAPQAPPALGLPGSASGGAPSGGGPGSGNLTVKREVL